MRKFRSIERAWTSSGQEELGLRHRERRIGKELRPGIEETVVTGDDGAASVFLRFQVGLLGAKSAKGASYVYGLKPTVLS